MRGVPVAQSSFLGFSFQGIGDSRAFEHGNELLGRPSIFGETNPDIMGFRVPGSGKLGWGRLGMQVGHVIGRHIAEKLSQNLWLIIGELIALQFFPDPYLVDNLATLAFRLRYSRK